MGEEAELFELRDLAESILFGSSFCVLIVNKEMNPRWQN